MIEIVTLEEAKLYLRVDLGEDDALIETLIGAATEAVLATADGWVPTDDADVPARLRLAVLTHVARVYDSRDDSADLPASAARLVFPFRALDV